VGVAADGLKYSELAKLRQPVNQAHHYELTARSNLRVPDEITMRTPHPQLPGAGK
jgi:hypothetical protein